MKIKQLNRRAFLRGTGVAIALPMLEAMLPRFADAAGVTPTRLLAYYVPCGIHMQSWKPAAVGRNVALSKTLAPLESVKNSLIVLSGLENVPAQSEGAGDHASGTGSFITATHVVKTEGADIRNGISLDQMVAQKIGNQTRLASLELGMDGGGSAGGCDSGYSCAYARNISWSSPKTPMPKITSPRAVFDRLFAGNNVSESALEAEKRRLLDKSILDYVLADARKLKLKLGANDRSKLDEYLTNIETLEQKLAAPAAGGVCTVTARPGDDSAYNVTQKAELMADLMVTAFQCDITRVQTFMLANAGSGRTYSFIGVDEDHHSCSHHQNLQSNYDKLEKINLWEMQQFAYLLKKLQATSDINGKSLLESSAVFFSSEISDGNRHNHDDLPVLLAGSANGYFDTGRHVNYSSKKPIANLFMSMLDALGAPINQFGDSTGMLNDLKKV